MDFCLYFPHLLPGLSEIHYRSLTAVQHWWVSWKLARGKWYLLAGI